MYNKHSYIAKEVNTLLKAPYNPNDVAVPGTPVNTTNPSNPAYNYIDSKTLVDATKITPYIATLDADLTDVNYTKLKKAGVVGVMLYGGSYYDDMHRIKKLYRSDNINKQVADANKASMPYALYVDVRARSATEAKLECNQLWYLISKYPPQLGIWLRLQTRASKSTNNNILKEYHKHLIKWGMKGNVGLYISRTELTSISWDKFYDDYSLWLIDRVDNIADVHDTLLTPEFFMLEEG